MTPEERAHAEDPLVGRIIAGKFALRRCVGTGASGSVYQSDQLALGRTVAIKVLRSELARDPRFVSRFHDEATAASRLNHPNTVSVIDYGQTDDGLLYLVMEFLRGPTLTQVLRSEQLRPTRIADIVSQILSGLEEAHDAGVIHADLKADNVVVERRRGDWDLVKVVDFGIARLVGQPTASGAEKTICGTPEYMAPEVIQGEDPTYASDLYSVGVMIYELLTGMTPFAGGASIEVLRRHLIEQPVPPSLRRPDVTIDRALEECALRALRKDPAHRYGSATEFRHALQRVITHRSEQGVALGPCDACGTPSPVSFKFCPDCGHPLQAAGMEVIMLDQITSGQVATARAGTEVDHENATLDGLPSVPVPVPVPVAEEDTRSVRREADGDLAGVSHWMPMVGRERELARLVGFLRGEVATSALQVVGRRGSGRARLVDAALDELSGVRVLRARRDPTELVRPFFPVRELVRAALRLAPDDRGRLPRLPGLVDELGLSSRDVPGIAELLGAEGPLWQLEPVVRRREVLASVCRLFAALGARGPLVLVVEDVDRFDQPSQEVVQRLVEAGQGLASPRIVLTGGPELAGAWPDWVEQVELGPLEESDLVALLEELREGGLPDELLELRQLQELCGGDPAHVQHLVRYVVEGGAAATAPAGLADLVAARIDHLPHGAHRVCQAISVFGEEIPRRWLAALADSDEDLILQGMSVLVSRNLVREIGGGELVQFTSSLVRDVVYESIPVHVRRDLHAGAAQILADAGAAPALLGHHLELAGEPERAAPLLSQAADDAVHELDDAGARRLYQRALGAARRVMLEDDDPAKRAQFVAIAVKLAESLRLGGQLGLARGLLDEVEFQCSDSRALRVQHLRALAHLHGSEGDVDAALAALRDAIGMAIVTGQRDLLCDLYLDVVTTQLREAMVPAAARELEEGIDLVTAGEGSCAEDGPDSLWRLLHRLSQLYALDGRREKAVQMAGHALKHALKAGARAGAARIQSMMAGHLEQLGQSERAAEMRRRAVDEMRRLGDRRATAELLLEGARPTQTYEPIAPASLREAQQLAEEVGWTEGAAEAGSKAARGRS